MQTTFLEIFSFGGVTPDLILIVVVYCGINFTKNSGIGLSVLVGFIQDCLSGSLLGVNTLSKGLVGIFFSALKDKIIVEGVLAVSFFIFCASLLDGTDLFSCYDKFNGSAIQGRFFLCSNSSFCGL